jgi:hypothetical protein
VTAERVAERKHRTIEVPSAEKQPKPVPDLMAALERTLVRLREGEDPRAGHSAKGHSRGPDGSKRRSAKASRKKQRAKSTS